ncbi:MAG TPA: type II toxin-antitoxin system HicB family antitoxin [Candidatus Udaeobacter sp.]|jgi:predicted RNase H-like HicB family nuclease
MRQRFALNDPLFLLILWSVDTITSYRRHAMKFAVVEDLGADEGYAARLPGFRGLLATGRTKKEALADLEDALADWVDLALKRGIGLPALREKRAATLTAA